MRDHGFTTLARFDSVHALGWRDFVEFSKMEHLTEVLSLDCCLCPCAVQEYQGEDGSHVAMDGKVFGCFIDETWARRRAPPSPSTQLLLIQREPACAVASVGPFRLQGFDLVDDLTRISALTNCGGFPLAFSPDQVNERGLLPTLLAAQSVQRRLREQYPNHDHADTSVYAIYRE